MLEHFTRNVQRQILRVRKTLYKGEVIGEQIAALVHNKNAAGEKLQALFKLLGVVVHGSLGGDIEQRVVGGGTLRLCVDMDKGFVVVVEFFAVKLVVLLVGYLALVLPPKRNHAV